jgi:hypothetical protein
MLTLMQICPVTKKEVKTHFQFENAATAKDVDLSGMEYECSACSDYHPIDMNAGFFNNPDGTKTWAKNL